MTCTRSGTSYRATAILSFSEFLQDARYYLHNSYITNLYLTFRIILHFILFTVDI